MGAFWWWVGLIGFWFAFRYIITVSVLMRTRFGDVNGSIVSAAEVPEYIRDLLTIPVDRAY